MHKLVENEEKTTMEHDIHRTFTNLVRHYSYTIEPHKALYYIMSSVQIEYADSPCTAFIIRDETAMVENVKKTEDEIYIKQLVASITHDLRTPLNGIMGIGDSLEQYVTREGRGLLKLIRNTGSLMLCLINDVLDLAQIEAKRLCLRKEAYSPREAVDETIQLLQFNFNQKGITLRTRFSRNVPTEIYSDKARYRQILINLMGNALKFTLHGEVVVDIFYDGAYDALITRVKDSGVGIPEEDRPRLFQRFAKVSNTSSINPSGVGLGLHVCKSLSVLLKGGIFVESTPGEGSAFTFYISCGIKSETDVIPDEDCIKREMQQNEPIEEEAKSERTIRLETLNEGHQVPLVLEYFGDTSPGEVECAMKSPKCECPSILLVDDNQVNLMVLKGYLASMPYKVEVAFNGQEAVDRVVEKSRNRCCKQYKVIYMDINMPIMNGIEAALMIKSMEPGKGTPIVALPAGCACRSSLSEIFVEILEKPISKMNFLDSVKKYF